MSEGNSSEPSEKKKSESSSENWKSRAQKPKVDNRFKTEDVTNTKGLTFEDFALSADLQLALYELGYEKPSPVQEEAIPMALSGRNIIARAKNGTGKTGAYSIPLVEKIDIEKNEI
jgi:ATP-dependent RNA helicase DDX6/DHH1